MLNRIKLTNFRKHRSTEIAFGGGLTCIRGANEASKTTVLEGLCYALLGVRALRTSVEDACTWGEEPKTMKVELEIVIDNVVYSIKRSKSGAEVNYDGGIVTGQTEVTSFLCRMLRIDAAAATRLMLSNQNEIRGALEAGAKATTDLIERLAEFDQIDKLLDLMQEHLTLGSTATIEAAIGAAQQALDESRERAEEPDLSVLQTRVGSATAEVEAAKASVAGAMTAAGKANEAVALERALTAQHVDLTSRSAQADRRVTSARAEITVLEAVQEPDNVEVRVEDLRQEIKVLESRESMAALRQSLIERGLMKPRAGDATLWEGDETSLKAETAGIQARVKASEIARATLDGDLRVLKAALTHGTCTFCGKDFSGVPEVAKKNAHTQNEIDGNQVMRKVNEAALAEMSGDLAALSAITKGSAPGLAALAKHCDVVRALDGNLPPVLVWTGPEYGQDNLDLGTARERLRDLQESQRKFSDAQAQLKQLRKTLAEAVADQAAISKKMADMPMATGGVSEVAEVADAAKRALKSAQESLEGSQETLNTAQGEIRDLQRAHKQAVEALERSQATLATRRVEMDALTFNNALLKRVRAARPLIADKLWNLVLHAVSAYFSEMRGTKSAVTKAADGFKVDGHSVATLSGSTLDILGLAIRVALVRTFLPAAPFLVLDEPCAAMDAERTQATLGFLVGCGFKQILLVTHEDVSESVASNMVQL